MSPGVVDAVRSDVGCGRFEHRFDGPRRALRGRVEDEGRDAGGVRCGGRGSDERLARPDGRQAVGCDDVDAETAVVRRPPGAKRFDSTGSAVVRTDRQGTPGSRGGDDAPLGVAVLEAVGRRRDSQSVAGGPGWAADDEKVPSGVDPCDESLGPRDALDGRRARDEFRLPAVGSVEFEDVSLVGGGVALRGDASSAADALCRPSRSVRPREPHLDRPRLTLQEVPRPARETEEFVPRLVVSPRPVTPGDVTGGGDEDGVASDRPHSRAGDGCAAVARSAEEGHRRDDDVHVFFDEPRERSAIARGVVEGGEIELRVGCDAGDDCRRGGAVCHVATAATERARRCDLSVEFRVAGVEPGHVDDADAHVRPGDPSVVETGDCGVGGRRRLGRRLLGGGRRDGEGTDTGRQREDRETGDEEGGPRVRVGCHADSVT